MARFRFEVLTILLAQLAIAYCVNQPTWDEEYIPLSKIKSETDGKKDEVAVESSDTTSDISQDSVDDSKSGDSKNNYDDLNGEETSIVFVNYMSHEVILYWNHGRGHDTTDGNNMLEISTIPIGSHEEIGTRVGHIFQYAENGKIHVMTVTSSDALQYVLIGPDKFRIRCSTTEGSINMNVIPKWSPLGAARFVHLMMIGYYEGCAINRVIPGFLAQFGIGPDYEARTNLASPELRIKDDPKKSDFQFKPGYMSYTADDINSRSDEIFIVMSDTAESQLKEFGKEPWETPFGFVDTDDLNNVVSKWNSEYGEGPDSRRMYEKDGYEYIKKEYPNISYIQECNFVLVESDSTDTEPEL